MGGRRVCQHRKLRSNADIQINLDGIDSGMADILIDNRGKEGETLEKYPRVKFDVIVEMSFNSDVYVP